MKSASLLIAAFLTLILGIAGFLVTIADEEQALVGLKSIGNESLDLTPARLDAEGKLNSTYIFELSNVYNDWRNSDGDCEMTDFVMRNQSGDTLTATTHYVFDATYGNLSVVNHDDLNESGLGSRSNSTAVDYKYCGTDYLSESWTRSVMDIVVGFFALAMLIISVGIFYQIARQEGLFSYGL